MFLFVRLDANHCISFTLRFCSVFFLIEAVSISVNLMSKERDFPILALSDNIFFYLSKLVCLDCAGPRRELASAARKAQDPSEY